MFFAPMEHTRPQILMSPFSLQGMDAWDKIAGDGNESRTFLSTSLVAASAGYISTFCSSGREALACAIRQLNLTEHDEIVISTTTDNTYISSCVTRTIELHCRWSRQVSAHSKAVLLIHEFGFPARPRPEILNLGLPIIADCAYGLGLDVENGIGPVADFYIFSFSKAFNVPSGGALLSAPKYGPVYQPDAPLAAALSRFVSRELDNLPNYVSVRRRNWNLYRNAFERHGIAPHPMFASMEYAIPHAFVVHHKDERRLGRVKEVLNSRHIESSIYYGGGGYFLPCHQQIPSAAIEYIASQFTEALNQQTIEK